MKIRQKPPEKIWAEFQEHIGANNDQMHQFKKYASYLLECNQLFNLTAVKELSGVVRQHFEDSLALAKSCDLSTVSCIADIGTGAGFPAIPLKIMYPHLKIVLIEVTKKKQAFLEDVIKILGLTDVIICGFDWRTFLRNADYDIDLFVTRAALDDLELIRMFRPACRYSRSGLVYWASKEWEPHQKSQAYITGITPYKIGSKERRLVTMSLQKPAAID